VTLAPDACYRALASRNPRFDGRFFVGVLSTGVYCRPICPARTPLRRNCRFFRSAAAAAESGFRPCRRCRPEAAPGSAAWSGTSAAVGRALRLIDGGALDRGSVEDLAATVGIGERHLRRLFLEHVGASPGCVARTRRVHFAKKLLDETSLPVTEVAHAAGFASIRRFNAAMQDAYHAAPRELRRRGRRTADADGGLTLRLAVRPPFAWRQIAAYLGPRSIPGAEAVGTRGYRRAVAVGEQIGTIELGPGPDERHLALRIPAALAPGLAGLSSRARRLCDLDADPSAILAHLRRDPALRPHLPGRGGLRAPGAWSGHELAVRAILGQQVSVAGATTLAGRLVARFGRPLPEPDAELTALFPYPATLADAPLESIGLPRQRATAIRALAGALATGTLDLDAPADPAAAREQLLELPGVGPWTAEYVALRALGEPDAFPSSDLGLRKALASGSTPLATRELERAAEAWRPWRSYAAMALWTSPRA